MNRIAHIIQSQDNWNEITIVVPSSSRVQEDWQDDPFRSTWVITSTAHVFSPDFPETDGMEFDPEQWEADIDNCLSQMGFRRTSDLTNVADFEQTCEVE